MLKIFTKDDSLIDFFTFFFCNEFFNNMHNPIINLTIFSFQFFHKIWIILMQLTNVAIAQKKSK